MTTQNDATRNNNASQRKPHAIVGAGRLVAAIWKSENEKAPSNYRFNVYRMNTATGRVTHRFAPRDIEHLVRLAQVLAIELSNDGSLDAELRDDLSCLEACLDEVLFRRGEQRPLHTQAGNCDNSTHR